MKGYSAIGISMSDAGMRKTSIHFNGCVPIALVNRDTTYLLV